MAALKQKARLWFHESKSFATVQRRFRLEYGNFRQELHAAHIRQFQDKTSRQCRKPMRISAVGSRRLDTQPLWISIAPFARVINLFTRLQNQ
ncbi:hypothetical protein AVEN_78312-1 [Araneus ventricosus]|uniref:DUF4817 domain-containing protein n=1 Tax=Araneus ventricosus TaxID=182803 RepID=A0A4Y2TRJ9_ARAVE|nr:hypothetical protein AVEN_78312-1 [Araneus ventricosus]